MGKIIDRVRRRERRARDVAWVLRGEEQREIARQAHELSYAWEDRVSRMFPVKCEIVEIDQPKPPSRWLGLLRMLGIR